VTPVEVIHGDVVDNRSDSVEPNGSSLVKDSPTLKSVRV